MVKVGLNDVSILKIAASVERGFHCGAEVDTHYFAGAPARCKFCMPALAASTFENDLVLKKLWPYRRDPAEELMCIELVGVRKVLPLPAKAFGSRCFVCFQSFTADKARYAASNWKGRFTGNAGQPPLHDLLTFSDRHFRQFQLRGTRWTDQVVKQLGLHAKRLALEQFSQHLRKLKFSHTTFKKVNEGVFQPADSPELSNELLIRLRLLSWFNN